MDNRSISIGIYDDRLEITSPGKLPKQMTVEKLKVTHYSCPRNKAIANVLYRRGVIEQWGSGTKEIIDECIESRISEPEFIEDDNTFIVKFNARFSPVKKAVITDTLTDRQKEILDILKQKSPLNMQELAEKIPNPPTNVTIRKHLLQLKKMNLIKSIGHAKTAKWKIMD